MKPVITALGIALVAALIGGCGSSGNETTGAPEPLKRAAGSGGPIGASVKRCPANGALGGLRVSGVGCATGVAVMASWNVPRCRPAKGQSRSSCTVRRYRCLAVRTARGTAVNCARRGHSITFTREP